MVLRQIGRADERDVDGGSAANNESAIVIERTDRETVGSALEGDLNGPIGHGGPGDAIVRTVDLERSDLDGRGARQRDRIGARTEVSAAVAGDREIRGDRRQLLGKIIAALADPGLHRGRRGQGLSGAAGHAAGDQSTVFRVHERVDVRGDQRPLHRLLDGAIIGASKRRVVVQAGDRRIIRGREQGRGGAIIVVSGAGEHDPVDVEHEGLPFSMLGFVGVHILADLVTPTVEVVDDMLDGEDTHHLLDVRQTFGLRGVRLRGGCVHGIDQREQIGVVVGRVLDRAGQPIPTVAGEFFGAARRGIKLQARFRVSGQGARIGKLKPSLELEQLTAAVVRDPFLDDFGAGLLDIFVDAAARLLVDAVDVEMNETPVVVRQTDLIGDPIGERLLEGGVVAAGPIEHKIRRAKKSVVRRKPTGVTAQIAVGRAVARADVRAAGEQRAHVVDRPVVIIDEGDVERGVVQLVPAGPGIVSGSRHPEPVGAQGASRTRCVSAAPT